MSYLPVLIVLTVIVAYGHCESTPSAGASSRSVITSSNSASSQNGTSVSIRGSASSSSSSGVFSSSSSNSDSKPFQPPMMENLQVAWNPSAASKFQIQDFSLGQSSSFNGLGSTMRIEGFPQMSMPDFMSMQPMFSAMPQLRSVQHELGHAQLADATQTVVEGHPVRINLSKLRELLLTANNQSTGGQQQSNSTSVRSRITRLSRRPMTRMQTEEQPTLSLQNSALSLGLPQMLNGELLGDPAAAPWMASGMAVFGAPQIIEGAPNVDISKSDNKTGSSL